jgi:hypothetical protein
MIPPSPSLEEHRFPKADIAFMPDRQWVSIHGSANFIRSFSLSSCEEIAVSDKGIQFTLLDGTRHLLLEPKPD